MRNRRVGTISMGTLLLGLGVLLLYAQFNEESSFDLLVKWWPAIFFLLGAEILAYTFLIKGEQPTVKYDIFSIFIVLILAFSGIGLYGLTQSGIVRGVEMMISGEDYVLELPAEEIVLEDSVRRVVIKAPPQVNLKVLTCTGAVMTAHKTAYAKADTLESAKEMLAFQSMTARQTGDTLYVSFSLPVWGGDFGYHAHIQDFTLLVPAEREVEIDSNSRLEVIVDSLEKDWLIDSRGPVELRIGAQADLAVEAVVSHFSILRGNVDWVIPESASKMEKEHDEGGSAEVVFGEGRQKISIIGRSDIIVNKIQGKEKES